MARVIQGSGNNALSTISQVLADIITAKKEAELRSKERAEDFQRQKALNEQQAQLNRANTQGQNLTNFVNEMTALSEPDQLARMGPFRNNPTLFEESFGIKLSEFEKSMQHARASISQPGIEGETEIRGPGVARQGPTTAQKQAAFQAFQDLMAPLREGRITDEANIRTYLQNALDAGVESTIGKEGVAVIQKELESTKRPVIPAATMDERLKSAQVFQAKLRSDQMFKAALAEDNAFVLAVSDPKSPNALYINNRVLNPEEARAYRNGKMLPSKRDLITAGTPLQAKSAAIYEALLDLPTEVRVGQYGIVSKDDVTDFILNNELFAPTEMKNLEKDKLSKYVKEMMPLLISHQKLVNAKLDAEKARGFITARGTTAGGLTSKQALDLSTKVADAIASFSNLMGESQQVTGRFVPLKVQSEDLRQQGVTGAALYDFEGRSYWETKPITKAGVPEKGGLRPIDKKVEEGANPITTREVLMLIKPNDPEALKTYAAYKITPPATWEEAESDEFGMEVMNAIAASRGIAEITALIVPDDVRINFTGGTQPIPITDRRHRDPTPVPIQKFLAEARRVRRLVSLEAQQVYGQASPIAGANITGSTSTSEQPPVVSFENQLLLQQQQAEQRRDELLDQITNPSAGATNYSPNFSIATPSTLPTEVTIPEEAQ